MENNVINNTGKSKEMGREKNKPALGGFVFESEDDRLLRDIRRPDIEKLQLFTKMIRRNGILRQIDKKEWTFYMRNF